MRSTLTTVLALAMGGYTYLACGWLANKAEAVTPEAAAAVRGGLCWSTANCPAGSQCDRRCDQKPDGTPTGCNQGVWRSQINPDTNGYQDALSMCVNEPACEYLVVTTTRCVTPTEVTEVPVD